MFQDTVDRYRRTLAQRAVSRYDLMAIILPLTIIIMAEAIFFFSSRGADLDGFSTVVLLHALNLAVCILIPIILKLDNSIYQAYALLSVLRILSIGMPNFGGIWLDWALLVYIPLIPVIWFALMDERFKFSMEPGQFPFRGLIQESRLYLTSLTGSINQMVAGGFAGLVIGMVAYLILDAPAIVSGAGFQEMLFAILILVALVAMVEELLFRRMLLRRIAKRFGPLMAVTLSALVFAAMHSSYVSIPLMAFMFLFGLALGLVYVHTGRLAITVPMHGAMLVAMMAIGPALL